MTTFVVLPDGVGRLEDDGSVAELDSPYPSLVSFLADGGSPGDLGRRAVRRRHPAPPVAGPDLRWPGTVWGIGMNYVSKQKATGRAAPERPTLFVKAATSLMLGGGEVMPPREAPECVDYEGEIAVVVGSPLYGASEKEAAQAVAFAAAANDLTARDVMRETGNPSLAKSFPGFGQLSAVLAEPDALGGLEALSIRTAVGDTVRQEDRSDGMLLSVGAILAHLSRYVALHPGDVVLTGTPAGTGDERGEYLRPGDVVEVVVGSLPPLQTRIVEGVPVS